MRIEIHAENCIAGGDAVTFPAGFLERNLAPANGEFLKVYILLLRAAQSGTEDGREAAGSAEAVLTETDLADRLDITLKDVRRALRWWNRRGEIEVRRKGDALAVTLTPERAEAAARTAGPEGDAAAGTLPGRQAAAQSSLPAARPDALSALKDDREFSQLLFVIETYRKEKFSRSHVEKIAYWYDTLKIPKDLIESIVESCVDAGHSSMNYIEAAVLKSHEEGIRTVEDWKDRNRMFRRDFFRILQAFGIRGRSPVEKERRTMEVWLTDYGFSLDIINEAAGRAIHKDHPFEYANSILKGWHEANVRTVGDIAALDEKHRAAAEEGLPAGPAGTAGTGARRSGFTNFPQRGGEAPGELMDELRGKNGNLV